MYICPGCKIEMRPKRNGVAAITMDTKNRPLELYLEDLWACPECDNSVIPRRNRNPADAHFMGDGELVSFMDRIEEIHPDMKFPYWTGPGEKYRAVGLAFKGAEDGTGNL